MNEIEIGYWREAHGDLMAEGFVSRIHPSDTDVWKKRSIVGSESSRVGVGSIADPSRRLHARTCMCAGDIDISSAKEEERGRIASNRRKQAWRGMEEDPSLTVFSLEFLQATFPRLSISP